ncbi:MAG: phenylalanine--tRNA ligase subunit beta [Candidatus Omnitrophota bacterium]|nr:MAG: phenylalanine--tRNA ligase subunit beta [Candidatus Omnitrophota bacterium]
MKISYNWLKEYVDVKIDPKKLAYLLTMAGINVTSCRNAGGDYIFEFEITSNRPDCLGIIGIAREVACLLGKKLELPKELQRSPQPSPPSKLPPSPRLRGTSRRAGAAHSQLDIELKDPELCPRYTARIIRNVEVRPSPDWLKEKIISIGLRPVNNIVDITNFVLFETGQPMHAFDLDRIKGSISVRRGIKGEKIITIDNVSRACNPDMLVIADANGPIAIGGIMGGLKTEVNKMTKNILLESAFFNPISIRRTSRALGLSSESSYRFERRITNDMVAKASNRGACLIEAIADGKTGPFIDIGKKTGYSKTINFDLGKTNKILGISIAKGKAVKILKTLGFSVKAQKTSMKVTVPSFRGDVKNDVDLTEELARIYGYEKIPLTIPHIIGNVRTKSLISLLQEKISQALARLGLNEIITYGLISKNSIKGLGIREDETVVIKNPLSIDQEIMRPTLLPGCLNVISYNFNRKARHVSLFEMGKIYREKKNSYIEEPVASIGLAGIRQGNWKNQVREFTFFDIKGMFEKLLEELGITHVVFKKGEIEGFNRDIASTVENHGKVIACFGEVDKNICERFNIEKKVFYGELYIGNLLERVKLDRRYAPISRYPSIMRDISVILDKNIASSEVTNIIKEIGKTLVKEVSLVDCYKGKQIPEGKRGLLYRIEFQSRERTLKDAEVNHLHSEIKKALSEKLDISFR